MAEYHEPAADASSRTTEDFFLMEHTQDASKRTADEDFSFLSQSQSTRNTSVANSESIVDRQSVNLRNEKMVLCNLCDKDLGVHLDESFTSKMYQCCICGYTSTKRAFLQQHINIHCARKNCKICNRDYTEGEPHCSETTCNVCKIEFACKTFLDQHCVVDHEKHFEKHCWVCGRQVSKHLNKFDGKTLYVCCACGYSSNVVNSPLHNKTHQPKLFCIRCKEEYPAEEKDWHDKEFKCMFCPQTFQCHTILENHLENHNDDLSSRCICCSETLYIHRKGSSYQCCVCFGYVQQKFDFRVHLCSHKGLRLFKCPECEKRFMHDQTVKKHSKNCVSLPIQCEKCKARFPTNESLYSHCLKKHTET